MGIRGQLCVPETTNVANCREAAKGGDRAASKPRAFGYGAKLIRPRLAETTVDILARRATD